MIARDQPQAPLLRLAGQTPGVVRRRGVRHWQFVSAGDGERDGDPVGPVSHRPDIFLRADELIIFYRHTGFTRNIVVCVSNNSVQRFRM